MFNNYEKVLNVFNKPPTGYVYPYKSLRRSESFEKHSRSGVISTQLFAENPLLRTRKLEDNQ